MVVLLVLLLLSNLWFGWAAGSSGTSNSSLLNQYEILIEIFRQLEEDQKKKEETCAKVKSALADLATSKNWKVEGRYQNIMSIKLPNGETFVINEDCKTYVEVPIGTLSPLNKNSTASLATGMVMAEDFKFQVDVSLFKILFQLLMYGAGIFWAVRAAQKLIAGNLTETLVTLFIGFIIIASMYVLYKWL